MSFLQFKLFESPKRAEPTLGERWIICHIVSSFVGVLDMTAIDILANGSATRFLEWLEVWYGDLPLLFMIALFGIYGTIICFLPRRFSYVIFPVLIAIPAAAHLATMVVSAIKGVPYFNDQIGWIILLMGVFLPICLFVTGYVSRELWIANRKAEGVTGKLKW